MRMDRSQPLTAAMVVNQWPEAQLREVLPPTARSGMPALSRHAIVREPGETANCDDSSAGGRDPGAMPAAALREKQHPAKRSFQGSALR